MVMTRHSRSHVPRKSTPGCLSRYIAQCFNIKVFSGSPLASWPCDATAQTPNRFLDRAERAKRLPAYTGALIISWGQAAEIDVQGPSSRACFVQILRPNTLHRTDLKSANFSCARVRARAHEQHRCKERRPHKTQLEHFFYSATDRLTVARSQHTHSAQS